MNDNYTYHMTGTISINDLLEQNALEGYHNLMCCNDRWYDMTPCEGHVAHMEFHPDGWTYHHALIARLADEVIEIILEGHASAIECFLGCESAHWDEDEMHAFHITIEATDDWQEAHDQAEYIAQAILDCWVAQATELERLGMDSLHRQIYCLTHNYPRRKHVRTRRNEDVGAVLRVVLADIAEMDED